mmetsp:Transcript_29515/g.29134  ORF Transcript_29515/g.29134 Transcript_29515/m.29134 type:complete len:99 (-) Transcript_29515:252-548(-)
MLLSQTGKDLTYPAVFTRNKALVNYVAFLLMILFCVLVASMVTFAFCKGNICFKTSEQKYHALLKKIDAKNKLEIDSMMKNMVNGEYKDLNITYVDKH